MSKIPYIEIYKKYAILFCKEGGVCLMDNNVNTSQPPEYTSSYRYVISYTAFFSQIALTMCLACLTPLGPYIREALNMNFTQFGLLFTLCNGGTMVFLWITGPLVDKFGIRKIMVSFTVLMAIGLFLAGRTNTAMQLIVLELCLGVFNSAAGPTGSKMISTWVGPKERGSMLSLKQAGIPMGSTIAGIILPIIATTAGWRFAYTVVAVFVLVVGILSGILYKDSSIMKAQMSSDAPKPTFRDNAVLIFKKDFVLLSIGCLFLMGAQFALSGNMSNYCTEILAAAGVANATVIAGWIYSVSNIAGIVGRLVFGYMSDRGSSKNTLMMINVVAAVFLVVLAIFGNSLGIVGMFLVMGLYGFAGFSWSGIQLGIASSMTPPQANATTTSITLSFSFGGMMIFSPIFGAVVDAVGFSAGFFFLAALTVIGILFLVPMKEKSAE